MNSTRSLDILTLVIAVALVFLYLLYSIYFLWQIHSLKKLMKLSDSDSAKKIHWLYYCVFWYLGVITSDRAFRKLNQVDQLGNSSVSQKVSKIRRMVKINLTVRYTYFIEAVVLFVWLFSKFPVYFCILPLILVPVITWKMLGRETKNPAPPLNVDLNQPL